MVEVFANGIQSEPLGLLRFCRAADSASRLSSVQVLHAGFFLVRTLHDALAATVSLLTLNSFEPTGCEQQ